MESIHTTSIASWSPSPDAGQSSELLDLLESGAVLYCPHLVFEFAPEEKRFFDPHWSNGKDKNISLEREGTPLKGMAGTAEEMAALCVVVQRFRAHAIGLIEALFPMYTKDLHPARTSFRPVPLEGRSTSW